VFNEGCPATAAVGGEAAIRGDLRGEAVRLVRPLRELMPTDVEVAGLLALVLLIEARRPARLVEGALVPLDQQDRSAWDRGAIEDELVRECLARNRLDRTAEARAAYAAAISASGNELERTWLAGRRYSLPAGGGGHAAPPETPCFG